MASSIHGILSLPACPPGLSPAPTLSLRASKPLNTLPPIPKPVHNPPSSCPLLLGSPPPYPPPPRRLKEKGFEVRASLDGPMPNEHMANNTHTMMGGNKGGYDMGGKSMQMGSMQMMGSMKGGPAVEPGRVILAVPDISMVDFFREQFAGLPVAMELVPALGPENTLQLVQQAMGLGGCDFVLLHPEFVRDRSPNGLVSRLRNMGQRTAAFGWAQVGPMRDLIDSSGVDAHLEGPSFGAGISPQNLLELIAMMQQAKKQGGMMMGGERYGCGARPACGCGSGAGRGGAWRSSREGGRGGHASCDCGRGLSGSDSQQAALSSSACSTDRSNAACPWLDCLSGCSPALAPVALPLTALLPYLSPPSPLLPAFPPCPPPFPACRHRRGQHERRHDGRHERWNDGQHERRHGQRHGQPDGR